MTKPFSLCAVAAALLLTATATAQRPAGRMVPPPRPNPAFASQPLVDTGTPTLPRQGGGSGGVRRNPQASVTRGVKVAGAGLKAAVETVAAMPWHSSLKTAKKQASQLDRPILLLQTLGEIDGFA